MHLERLWDRNITITITTRLVDTVTTPMLLKTVRSRGIDLKQLITHRFKLDNILEAYETFGRGEHSGAQGDNRDINPDKYLVQARWLSYSKVLSKRLGRSPSRAKPATRLPRSTDAFSNSLLDSRGSDVSMIAEVQVVF